LPTLTRSLTLNTRDKLREWTEDWAKAFSEGRITNPEYIDAGDVVIAQFNGEGGYIRMRSEIIDLVTVRPEGLANKYLKIREICLR